MENLRNVKPPLKSKINISSIKVKFHLFVLHNYKDKNGISKRKH